MTTPVLKVAIVSGRMGFPAESFTGERLAAQRIDAMFMKSEVFATCRPG